MASTKMISSILLVYHLRLAGNGVAFSSRCFFSKVLLALVQQSLCTPVQDIEDYVPHKHLTQWVAQAQQLPSIVPSNGLGWRVECVNIYKYRCHTSKLYACNINKFHGFDNECWNWKEMLEHAYEALVDKKQKVNLITFIVQRESFANPIRGLH